MTQTSAGAKFRTAVAEERPLQIPGAINAYHAILAKASGFRAIYLSGDFDAYWQFHIEQDQRRLYPAWTVVLK